MQQFQIYFFNCIFTKSDELSCRTICTKLISMALVDIIFSILIGLDDSIPPILMVNGAHIRLEQQFIWTLLFLIVNILRNPMLTILCQRTLAWRHPANQRGQKDWWEANLTPKGTSTDFSSFLVILQVFRIEKDYRTDYALFGVFANLTIFPRWRLAQSV